MHQQLTEPQSKRTNPLLIPDCCNIGIVFRVLIAVNSLVLFGLLARGQSYLVNVQDFIETSMLVELITLLSLLCLCGFRTLLLTREVSNWVQRAACGLVPALICAGLLKYFEGMDWFYFSFPRLQVEYATLLCFVIGLSLQHYFELRSR
jgi:two-component system sensor histidine kinase AlgZ